MSVAQAALSARITSVICVDISALSAKVVSISAQLVSLEVHASAASAAATSADAHANTVSAAVETLSAKVVSVSAQLTSVDAKASIVSDRVTSISAQFTSVNLVLQGPTTKVIADAQGISATAFTDISGMSISVANGGIYQLQAFLFFNKTGTGTPYAFTLTFGTMTQIRGRIACPISVAQGIGTISTNMVGANFEGASASGSVILSVLSGNALTSLFVTYAAGMVAGADGVVQLQAKVSVSGGQLNFQPGSWMQLFRIA
jgi:hypothetical protein